MLVLKNFQIEAIENALEVFEEAHRQLVATKDLNSRRLIISHNGCILIEAPTGAGKTVIAGHIADRLSRRAKVVWFWFTPFKGLVGQASKTIREEFSGLRVRDIHNDRSIESLRSGDVFVTTWSSVAARNSESRRARVSSESLSSIDEMVVALRSMGYYIGVIVDEAHHGFGRATEALSFYKRVLSPEYTLLVTATPRNTEIERFKQEVNIAELHKISISREDCVNAGLVKQGVRAVAYLADDSASELVDYERTALRHGLTLHRQIESELENIGVNMKPLMLVQVDSRQNSVEEAKRKLVELGEDPNKIATHTADEPDPNLLALAADENVSVLIFKMAIALGFDAPRAFTLVSMRKSRDADFGVQIVGRIMRVDKRLQNLENVPKFLQYGYVFLADYNSQTGLTNAADRINSIRTELTSVSHKLGLVTVCNTDTRAQLLLNGQGRLWHDDEEETGRDREEVNIREQEGNNNLSGDDSGDSTGTPTSSTNLTEYADPNREITTNNGTQRYLIQDQQAELGLENNVLISIEELEQLSFASLFGEVNPQELDNITSQSNTSLRQNRRSLNPNARRYSLQNGIQFPRVLMRERYPLGEVENIIRCISSHINFNGEALASMLTRVARVTRKEIDLFENKVDSAEDFADISLKEVGKKAQLVLFENEYINGRELYDALIQRLKQEVYSRGWSVPDESIIRDGLNMIICNNPDILRRAQRLCLGNYVVCEEANEIPPYFDSETLLPPARLNIYGVFPNNMNRWERRFAEIIDNDVTGTVLWWHRNEPRKPWSASVAVPDCDHDYYPDFVVGVRDRNSTEQILLVEIKERINSKDSIAKARAVHKLYGRVMMLYWDDERAWHTVVNNERGDRNELGQRFNINIMAGY
ncbi:DEAD/DEAH box helicase [Brevibacillus agri]|uniref:DEAD/DEAH box helicase n=1 Tax=Brevibacillus agri TaxID=51101 RepID=UPI001EE62C1C|nr:DEAD/DEAH box helicase family protein [Brevibacillus agri]MCG5251356.1 DEAD/DEAH box helicase family protein [Brevibacillus agri]